MTLCPDRCAIFETHIYSNLNNQFVLEEDALRQYDIELFEIKVIAKGVLNGKYAHAQMELTSGSLFGINVSSASVSFLPHMKRKIDIQV